MKVSLIALFIVLSFFTPVLAAKDHNPPKSGSDCDLQISISIGNCVAASSTVPVNVVVSDPLGGAHDTNIFLDGILFPWCPVDIRDDEPSIFTCWVEPGMSHTIYAVSLDEPCEETRTFFVPACPCALNLTGAVSGACNSSTLTVPVTLNLTASYPVGSGFNLLLDGSLVAGSPFAYAASSTTTITVNVPGTGSNHTFIARDETNPNCSDNHIQFTPLCTPPPCQLGITASQSGSCNSNLQVPYNATITASNAGALGFRLFLDGNLVPGSPFAYAASGTTIPILVAGNGASHVVQVQDVEMTNCTSSTTFVAPLCTAPVCSVSVTAAQAGNCAGNMAPYAVTVTGANVGSAFQLILDGVLVAGSPFAYNSAGSSTTVFVNVPGNGAAHTIQVIDNQTITCASTFSFISTNCTSPTCSVSVTAAQAGNCAGNMAPYAVTVTGTNVGSAFQLLLDGVLVAGSPFAYNSSGSSTTIFVNVPGNGAAHTIQVIDNQTSTCASTFSFISTNCASPTCSVSVTAAQAGNCAGNMAPYAVTVTGANVGSAFQLLLDGVLVAGSPFAYNSSGSSTTVFVNVLGNGAAHTIQVVDNQTNTCASTFSFISTNCATPMCSISVTAAQAGNCAGNMAPYAVTITGANVGSAFQLLLDGVLVAGSPFAYNSAGSSTTVFVNVLGNGAAHTIQVIDNQANTCASTFSFISTNCASPTCSVSVTAAQAGNCAGNMAPYAVTVTGANVGSAFQLLLDGVLVAGSPFAYNSSSSSTTVFVNVPGNGAAHTIQVVDNQTNTCASTFSFISTNCASPTCSVSVTAAQAGNCAGGVAPYAVTVTGANVGSAFQLLLDGVLVAGSPFAYNSAGSSTIVFVNVPGNGAAQTIQVIDNQTSTCASTFSFISTNCSSPACSVSVTATQAGNCAGNMAPYAVTVTGANVGSAFQLLLDGVLVAGSPFAYNSSGSSTTVFVNVPGNGAAHTIQVIDNQTNTCASTFSFISTNCASPTCSVSVTAAQAGNCAGGVAPYAVTVTGANVGSAFQLLLDGVLVAGSPFAYNSSGSSTTVFVNVPGNGAAHTIQVIDNQTSTCASTFSFISTNCASPTCSVAVTAEQVSDCEENEVLYAIRVTGANLGSAFNISLDGVPLTGSPFAYNSTGNSTTILLSVPGDGVAHTIQVVDNQTSTCASLFSFIAPLCQMPICQFANLQTSVGTECIGGTVQVEFAFDAVALGQQGFTIMLDGELIQGANYPYAASGTTVVSVPVLADGSPHEFMLSDNAQSNCLTILNLDIPNCGDPCLTYRVYFEANAEPLALNVTFDAMTAASGTSQFTWDFGDGTNGVGDPITHAYPGAAIYGVCLIGENELGCLDTFCQTFNLSDPCTFLKANFVKMESSNNPLLFDFQDISTGFPSQWLWGFGDGGTSLSQNPSHQYATPGTYNVCLVVQNSSTNCTSEPICKTVEVDVNSVWIAPKTQRLKIYPNPILDRVEVVIEGLPETEWGRELRLLLTDAMGRSVHKQVMIGEVSATFQRPEKLPAGCYHVQVTGAHGTYTTTLVVLRQ
jgi:hypothetical protein